MADVERSLLSKIISTGELATVVGANIDIDHFYDDDCADIYDWMLGYQRKYKDAPTARVVKKEFPDWNAEIVKEPLKYHLDQFIIKSKERAAIEAVRGFHDALEDPDCLPEIELYALEMARGLTEVIPSPAIQSFSAMPSRQKEYQRRKKSGIRHGIEMGIPTFDKATEGYQPTDLIVCVAYFGVGKSTWMQYLAYMAYLQGKVGEIVSLEMEAEAILRKLDTLASNVKYAALKALELEAGDYEQWSRIAEQAHKDKHERDIHIRDDVQNCTVDKIMADMIRFKPDVMMVDYLELMSSSRSARKSTWESVSENGIGLKEAARTMKIPVVTAAQLNREGGRGDVNLANVSYQSIGKHSDILVGLSQDDEQEARQEMEAILLKNRDGKKGMRPTLRWELERMSIGEKGKQHHFPERTKTNGAGKKTSRRKRKRGEQEIEIARNLEGQRNPWAARRGDTNGHKTENPFSAKRKVAS